VSSSLIKLKSYNSSFKFTECYLSQTALLTPEDYNECLDTLFLLSHLDYGIYQVDLHTTSYYNYI
ncbi:9843_t:CDS:1, partial [Racocetra persica]